MCQIVADLAWWEERYPGDEPGLADLRRQMAASQWPMAVRATSRQADCSLARGDGPGFLQRLKEVIALAETHGLTDLARSQQIRYDSFQIEMGVQGEPEKDPVPLSRKEFEG
jgi:hypothetical protein